MASEIIDTLKSLDTKRPKDTDDDYRDPDAGPSH